MDRGSVVRVDMREEGRKGEPTDYQSASRMIRLCYVSSVRVLTDL